MTAAAIQAQPTRDARFLAAARRGQHGVHVPRRWRDALDAPEYALLLVLLSMRAGRERSVVVGQRTIAVKLGRDRQARTDHVGRVTQRLVDAGAIATTRTARGSGVTRYQLLEQDGRYDVIPWPLLRALEAGECTVGEVRTYAHLTDAMGARGWTSDTAGELAARVGTSSRTLRRHVAVLEALGVLGVKRVPTAGLWLLERIDGDGQPSAAVDVEGVDEDLLAGPGDAGISVPQGVDVQVGGSDTDVGSPLDTDVGSYRDLAPEMYLAPEIDLSSSRSARHLGERGTGATSGRTRPRGGIYQVEGVTRVAEVLQTDRAWRHGPRRRWINGILSRAARPALEQGIAPEAIGHALITRAAGDLDEAAELDQPLIVPARDALIALAIDIRLGHACRDCGRTLAEVAQTTLTAGRCGWCHEQLPGGGEIELGQVLEAPDGPAVQDDSSSATREQALAQIHHELTAGSRPVGEG